MSQVWVPSVHGWNVGPSVGSGDGGVVDGVAVGCAVVGAAVVGAAVTGAEVVGEPDGNGVVGGPGWSIHQVLQVQVVQEQIASAPARCTTAQEATQG